MRSPLIARATSPSGPVPQGVHLSLDDGFALPASADYASLPTGEEPPGLSRRHLFVNVIMSITGTTILGVSAEMKRGGLLLTPLVVCVVAMIISEMTRVVSATVDQMQAGTGTKVRAYQDFIEGALGARGRALSSVTCTMDLLCAICIGLIVMAQNCQFLLPITRPWPLGDGTPQESGRKWWALLLSSSTLVYSFVELGPLVRFASTAGPAVSCISISLALIGSITAGADASGFPLDCREDLDQPYWSITPSAEDGALLSFMGVLSYFFYCFAMVVTVPSLKSEMAQPKELPRTAGNAYEVCVVIFLLIMGVGYGVFGNLGPENLIQGMRTDRPAGWWATTRPWESGRGTAVGSAFSALVTTMMLLIDCTYVPCAVIAVEGTSPELFRSSRVARAGARLFVVLARLLVATQVRSFVALSSLSSALFCMSNNVLMPLAAFYRTGTQKVSLTRRLAHALTFLLGRCVVGFGTWSALGDILWPPTSQLEPVGVYPRPEIAPACQAEYRAATAAAYVGL